MKKLVINILPLYSPLTGVGKVTYYLVKKAKEIAPYYEYFYYSGFFSKEISLRRREVAKKLISYLKDSFLYSVLKKLKNRLIISKRPSKDISFDIYIEPNFIPISQINASFIISIVHDFSFHLYPEWHPKERISFFKEHFWKNIKRADKIVVVSDFILKQAVSFGIPKEKLTRIYCGLDHSLFKIYRKEELAKTKRKYKLPDKFILFVGSIEPRKNLISILKAYSILPDSLKKEYQLILVGFSGWKNKEIMKEIKKQNIRYIGYVSEEDLAKIYNLAKIFIYPSLYEGFGLPPIEAMACGCPTIVSNIASIPEVCGDASFYVDPFDINDIAKGILKVLKSEDLRNELIAKGLKRARRFCWEKTAKQILSLIPYRDV